ncbi:MAG TPA: TadE/TadG family type IV pilus assembly protein [Candidatus Limnocylindrales bacterium]|nr:TadE/TadG family type IV pilus assembly protein [Candidatus Limnocylindrales bacterium]
MGIQRRRERGQTLVIVALAMVAILGMAGLVVDGGNAFSQQRSVQNALDAASEAGAVVLVQNLPFEVKGQTGPKTDTDVFNAMVNVAGVNSVTSPTGEYTDIDGNVIGVTVGSLGNVPPPSGAAGVRATGSRNFSTYFAHVFGIGSFTATASATAVAGAINSTCTNLSCGFIPVTFPTSLTTCDGTNHQFDWGNGGPYTKATPPLIPGNETIIPLCSTTDGSVGWLDIVPHSDACNGNGTSFLACEILNGPTQVINLPIWIATQTGNTNNINVQNALNTLTGPTVGVYEAGLDTQVTIPLYDCMDNNVGQLSPGPNCPSPAVHAVGNNTYYHIVGLATMILDKAYINANNPECNQAPGSPAAGGNGGTGCLKGWIVDVSLSGGTVNPPNANSSTFGVQLIG